MPTLIVRPVKPMTPTWPQVRCSCLIILGVLGFALAGGGQVPDSTYAHSGESGNPTGTETGPLQGTLANPFRGLVYPTDDASSRIAEVSGSPAYAISSTPLPGRLGSNPFSLDSSIDPIERSTLASELFAPRPGVGVPSVPFPLPAAVPGAAATFGNVAVAGERQVSWKLVIPNFLNDQKQIWLFPFGAAERHPVPTMGVIAATAALIALDQVDTPYFRRTGAFGTYNDIFKVTTTERVFLGLPVVWYFGGLALHDNYAEQTGFFAAESLADVDLLAGVMRSLDGRLHPRDISANGDFVHTWLKAKGTYVNRGSFPSGHTAGAFAVATVIARRYGKRHRWVPIVAYSLASLTAVSRITESAHFPSDVFMGAAISYTISRYVVLREP